MTATINADAACTINERGNVLWAKDIDAPWQTASTMKLLAAITARDWVNLSSPISPTIEDIGNGSGHLVYGDTVSWGDLIRLSVINSSNSAARAVGNHAHPEGLTAMLSAMHEKGTALGWTGHVIGDPIGGGGAGGNNRLSAWQLCSLIRHVYLADPWLYQSAGFRTYFASVWGSVRVGLIKIGHSFNFTDIPEFESGKTGTGNAENQHIVWGWVSEGRRYFSSVIDSPTRYQDARAMMDDVMRATTRRRNIVSLI